MLIATRGGISRTAPARAAAGRPAAAAPASPAGRRLDTTTALADAAAEVQAAEGGTACQENALVREQQRPL